MTPAVERTGDGGLAAEGPASTVLVDGLLSRQFIRKPTGGFHRPSSIDSWLYRPHVCRHHHFHVHRTISMAPPVSQCARVDQRRATYVGRGQALHDDLSPVGAMLADETPDGCSW